MSPDICPSLLAFSVSNSTLTSTCVSPHAGELSGQKCSTYCHLLEASPSLTFVYAVLCMFSTWNIFLLLIRSDSFSFFKVQFRISTPPSAFGRKCSQLAWAATNHVVSEKVFIFASCTEGQCYYSHSGSSELKLGPRREKMLLNSWWTERTETKPSMRTMGALKCNQIVLGWCYYCFDTQANCFVLLNLFHICKRIYILILQVYCEN